MDLEENYTICLEVLFHERVLEIIEVFYFSKGLDGARSTRLVSRVEHHNFPTCLPNPSTDVSKSNI